MSQTDKKLEERPDLIAWRRRHEIRRSSAASRIPSKKTYRRSTRTVRDRSQRDA
jgi:hypothetical protein